MLHKTILVLTKKKVCFYVFMIFYPMYSKVFVPMVKSGNKFLHFIAAEGVANLIVRISCRFLIHKHPDLDKDYLKHLHE